MTERKSWRGVIKVHPAADMWPMMSEDELRALAADIDAHGLVDGPTFYCEKELEDLKRKELIEAHSMQGATVGACVLLDGRNRLEAIHRFSKNFCLFDVQGDRRESILSFANYGDEERTDARVLHPRHIDSDPYGYTASRNAHRRHLTAEQKRDLIAQLLKAKPERSDRATAAIVGADHKTAGVVRATLAENGEIPRLQRTGRSAPVVSTAPKPPRAPTPPARDGHGDQPPPERIPWAAQANALISANPVGDTPHEDKPRTNGHTEADPAWVTDAAPQPDAAGEPDKVFRIIAEALRLDMPRHIAEALGKLETYLESGCPVRALGDAEMVAHGFAIDTHADMWKRLADAFYEAMTRAGIDDEKREALRKQLSIDPEEDTERLTAPA
jgi:hypothetical protein